MGYSKKERTVRDELNAMYTNGCTAVKDYIRKQLSIKAGKDMKYNELCSLRDELNTIQNKEDIRRIDEKLAEISNQEKENNLLRFSLYEQRYQKFCELPDVTLKYTLDMDTFFACLRIFMIVGEKEETIYESGFTSEEPYEFELNKCPEKYKTTFRMLWHQAWKEKEEIEKKKKAEEERIWQERLNRGFGNFWGSFESSARTDTIPKEIKKKFIRTLEKQFHPNAGGDNEMIQYVYQLRDYLNA